MMVAQPPDHFAHDPSDAWVFPGVHLVPFPFWRLNDHKPSGQVANPAMPVGVAEAPPGLALPERSDGRVRLTSDQHHVAKVGFVIRPTPVAGPAGGHGDPLYLGGGF